jgi:V-type H+-transporting ATPase subunit E
MNSVEMAKRVEEMKTKIQGKAETEKASITEKGQEEFLAEVAKIKKEETAKITAQHEKKVKEIDTQYKIAKSLAMNKKRLEKIKKRQELMQKLAEEAQDEVVKELKDNAKCEKFVEDLIAQGLLMLLEPEVLVMCRKSDEALVKKCVTAAEKTYTKVIKDKTGADKKCKLTVSTTAYLDPEPVKGKDQKSCLGGVVLSCFGGKIKVDNTIDARLKLVMEQDKPAIRAQLFPPSA